MDYAFLWGAFIGLFAIIDPFSTAFVYVEISSGDSKKKIKLTAKRASIAFALILIFFILFGTALFHLFSITIEAFQIAGGLIIAIAGFQMLYPKPKLPEEEEIESRKKEDISIIPLAIPMLSGPGAITAVLVWSGKAAHFSDEIGLILIPIIIGIISYFILANARHLKNILGQTGTNVVSRLLGLIVLVMGVQFIINGVSVVLPSIL